MVSTLRTQGQQGSKQGCSQVSGRKYAGQRSPLPAMKIDFWLLDLAANVDDEQSGQDADPEHNPPGDCMREPREENSKQNDAQTPADGPPGLNSPHSAPAKPSANALAHQRGAHR